MNESPTLAEQLADMCVSVSYDDLPDDVVESVRMRVLDTLGIAAAASPLDTARAARRWAASQGGTPVASAVGVEHRLSAANAAFVNGTLAHALDYDDTHLPSVLHPSAAVIPSALAMAEKTGASGQDLTHAVAMGLEVCVRLGMAGYDHAAANSMFFEHGQHATSICGVMGGAVAASMLATANRGGSTAQRRDGVVHALGVAASMSSGIIESNRTGGTVKRIHCGWAAHAGVAAAELAEYGLTGPPTVLEGRFGFFQAWLHGNFNSQAVTEALGTSWSIPNIFFKPYPANHFTHTAIDAARALRERGLHPDDIQELSLGVPAPNARTIGEPIEVKREPQTGYMAQFSGPYAVAVGLLGGGGLGAGLDDFTDALATDPQRRSIMARVSVVADEKCTSIFPYQFPARLTARLTDGSEVTEEALTNRGGPQHPLSFDELVEKFNDNASRVLPDDAVSALAARCRDIERCPEVSTLFTHLTSVDPLLQTHEIDSAELT